MAVISRTRKEYVNEFVTQYHTGLAVGVEDVLPCTLHQESSVKDLKLPHHQLAEVKATAMEHPGWPRCLHESPKRGKERLLHFP